MNLEDQIGIGIRRPVMNLLESAVEMGFYHEATAIRNVLEDQMRDEDGDGL